MNVQPQTTVKVNRLCVNQFRLDCHEQGIDWQVSNTKINSLKFQVIMTIGSRRAYLTDGKSSFWVDQALLLPA